GGAWARDRRSGGGGCSPLGGRRVRGGVEPSGEPGGGAGEEGHRPARAADAGRSRLGAYGLAGMSVRVEWTCELGPSAACCPRAGVRWVSPRPEVERLRCQAWAAWSAAASRIQVTPKRSVSIPKAG